jgi:hypothetical protein
MLVHPIYYKKLVENAKKNSAKSPTNSLYNQVPGPLHQRDKNISLLGAVIVKMERQI